jgi:hypothetical protein
MGRNARVEGILQAWFELDHCAAPARAAAEATLNRLLDSVVEDSKGQFTRDQILDHLFPSYKDFRATKYREEKLKIAQAQVKN